MDKKSIFQKIGAFLDANQLGILSTIHTDREAPQSAVVGFGNTKDLELIFGTSQHTRKYKNLHRNSAVALVIGWSSTTGSLQYEGRAHELSPEALISYRELLLKKNASHERFFDDPYQRYFLVKPTWIRFYDNAGKPPDIYELNF